MEAKVYRFYATTISGLEEVVLDELRECLPGLGQVRLERGRRHGRVFFAYTRSPRRLLELRAPLNTFALLAQIRGITVGRPGLERLEAQLARVDLQPALRLSRACEAGVDVGRFQLSATLQGTHRFSQAELAQRVRGLLCQAHGLAPGEGQTALRFHLQVEGSRALFGLQVGHSRARQVRARGGLSGPLAYCLARLLPSTGKELLLALGCSPSGVEEIARAGALRCLVACGQHRGFAPAAAWLVGVPAALPLAAGCADLALGAVSQAPAETWLGEVARVLQPGGVAALLAEKPRAFAAALRAVGALAIAAELPINIKGRRHALFLLERPAGKEGQLLQIGLPPAERG